MARRNNIAKLDRRSNIALAGVAARGLVNYIVHFIYDYYVTDDDS